MVRSNGEGLFWAELVVAELVVAELVDEEGT